MIPKSNQNLAEICLKPAHFGWDRNFSELNPRTEPLAGARRSALAAFCGASAEEVKELGEKMIKSAITTTSTATTTLTSSTISSTAYSAASTRSAPEISTRSFYKP
jgi:hypothetical protein